MKKQTGKIVKAVQVESPVVSALIIGYFVLFIASVLLITKKVEANSSDTLTGSGEIRIENQVSN